jgi:hypothetical protein
MKISPLHMKESRTVDMNKLRMTGFECFAIFVIRCARSKPEGCGPPLTTRAMSRNCILLMSFPIEQVRLNSSIPLFLYHKCKKKVLNYQIKIPQNGIKCPYNNKKEPSEESSFYFNVCVVSLFNLVYDRFESFGMIHG